MGCAEALEFVSLVDEHTGLNAYTTIRGVGPQVQSLRPELHLIEGRMFNRGAHEVIAGRAVQNRLAGLKVGSSITLPNGIGRSWAPSTAMAIHMNRRCWRMPKTLLNAYHRNDFNSVTVALRDPGDFERFSAALSANPTLSVKAHRETEYFATITKSVSELLLGIALWHRRHHGARRRVQCVEYDVFGRQHPRRRNRKPCGPSVSARAPVVASVLAEAVALGLAGALLGSAIAWLLLSGATMSAMTGVTPTQLTFHLAVSPTQMLIGSAFAGAIVIAGGLLAAIRAARIPIAAALQMS